MQSIGFLPLKLVEFAVEWRFHNKPQLILLQQLLKAKNTNRHLIFTRGIKMNNNNNNQNAQRWAIGAGIVAAGVYVLSTFLKGASPQPQVSEQENPRNPSSSSSTSSSSSATSSPTSVYAGCKTTIQVLERINKNCLKLDGEDIAKENGFLKTIVTEVIEWMKLEDPLFKKLYQEIAWTGSYYEGLKIEKPDEFDLNVVLRFPFKNNEIQITSKGAIPGNVCISNFKDLLLALKSSKPAEQWNYYKKMEKWCDANGALEQKHVRTWLESLLDKFINKHKQDLMRRHNLNHLRFKKSGPALTLELNKMSIDLVPAFECRGMTPPSPFKKIPQDLSHLPWYLIPKPVPGRDAVWRISFFKHEQELLNGKQNLKPSIKLMKKMRDTKDWKNLHSYFIKTVALWEINDNRIHNHMKMDELFFHLAKRLQERLERNDLKSRWDPRLNLLSNMKDKERENIANTLKRIIRQFDMYHNVNPEKIGEIIAPSAEE